MNGLLKLAIEGHGGLRRWEQLSRFRVAASITGAIWALKGQPGLLDGVVLAGETRDQRLTITPFPRPGQYATCSLLPSSIPLNGTAQTGGVSQPQLHFEVRYAPTAKDKPRTIDPMLVLPQAN